MFHRMSNYGEMEAKPFIALTRELTKKSLPKYKRHDDLIIVQHQAWEEFKKSLSIPVTRNDNSPFSIDEDELASLLCQLTQKPVAKRLAIERKVKSDDFRSPTMELLLGDNGIVCRKENHLIYRFDITKCMFSFGNINEKMRMGELDCSDEIIVDLFAGIGYFTLPLLVHAKAKHLYACEWNPDAIDALRKNLILNKVDINKCTIIEGDNKSNRPTDVAQRVILGILPSCLDWMQTAFECVDKSTGAILHCHDLVDFKSLGATRQSNNEKQTSHSNNNSLDITSNGDKAALNVTISTTNSSISFLNRSFSSSSLSHSIVEKPGISSDDSNKQQIIVESDKDNNSPVLLEKPNEFSSSYNSSVNSAIDVSDNNGAMSNCAGSHDTGDNSEPATITASPSRSAYEPPDTLSLTSLLEDNSCNDNDQPRVSDEQQAILEQRGQDLIAPIRVDVEAHDLTATLIHIQHVKSYAPHVSHFVFDIKIEPKRNGCGKEFCCENSLHPEAFHQDWLLNDEV